MGQTAGKGEVMPIRPENRARYPADWPRISAEVRAAAGNICEWCTAPNGEMIRRGTCWGRPVWSLAASAHCDVHCADTGLRLIGESHDTCDLGPAVRVVLTVAHLDHAPENCARENLRALCQRCHNLYDAPTRRRGIADRARAARAVGDLLEGMEAMR
jgi:5-methylcytosine-specific restriction endonuclease McrA